MLLQKIWKTTKISTGKRTLKRTPEDASTVPVLNCEPVIICNVFVLEWTRDKLIASYICSFHNWAYVDNCQHIWYMLICSQKYS